MVVAVTARITKMEISPLRIVVSSFRGSPSLPDASHNLRIVGCQPPRAKLNPRVLVMNADDGPTRIRIEVRGRVSTGLNPVNLQGSVPGD